jgi:transcriptional regulator with XRE-family HTH domain
MNSDRKLRLEAAGYKVGSADEFLKLTPGESALVSLRLALAKQVRNRRVRGGHTQTELARCLGSSQSRVAKLEAAESNVSIDLLFRALFATGAKVEAITRALEGSAGVGDLEVENSGSGRFAAPLRSGRRPHGN